MDLSSLANERLFVVSGLAVVVVVVILGLDLVVILFRNSALADDLSDADAIGWIEADRLAG